MRRYVALRGAGGGDPLLVRTAPRPKLIDAFLPKVEELADAGRFATRTQARTAVAGFIDEYNNDRRHSTAGRLPPAVYEAQIRTERAA